MDVVKANNTWRGVSRLACLLIELRLGDDRCKSKDPLCESPFADPLLDVENFRKPSTIMPPMEEDCFVTRPFSQSRPNDRSDIHRIHFHKYC